MTLTDRYLNEKPIGIYSFHAFFGVLFFEPAETQHSDNYYICCLTNGTDRWNFRRHNIRYYHDRPFIYKANSRIYLDEVMRYNI